MKKSTWNVKSLIAKTYEQLRAECAGILSSKKCTNPDCDASKNAVSEFFMVGADLKKTGECTTCGGYGVVGKE